MGKNEFGQLGDGTTDDHLVPHQILSSDVSEVALGQYHLMYIKTDGSLWGLGRNNQGQLGDGSTTDRTSPVQVRTSGISMVSAGMNHTFFIDVNGSLWGVGSNGSGRLGDGSTTNRSSPVQIMSTGITKVVTGNGHTLFLDENGTLRGMGYNANGRVGDGSTTNRTSPVVVATGVTEIGVGEEFSHFIDTNGTLWGMGGTGSYKLGDGQNSVNRLSPVQIISGAAMNPKEVTFHTTIGGVIKGAGKHDFNATATLTAVPEPGYLFSGWSGGLSGTTNPATLQMNQDYEVNATFVPDLGDSDGDGTSNYAEGLLSVAAGTYHTLLLKTDGSLWGTGGNAKGQLGDGTTVNKESLS